MGVLRKSPYDKVKIDPAKLWGGITIFALFASLAFYVFRPEETVAQHPVAPTPEEEVEAGYDQQHHDPNCKPIRQGILVDGELQEEDPEAGLVRVCGRVTSSWLERTDADNDGTPDYLSDDIGMKGVTVAVYEGVPDADNGKTFKGNLTHLFSSTSTNDQGYFNVHTRGLGPKGNKVYVVAFCGDEYKGGVQVHSMRHLSNLSLKVDCDPAKSYSYKMPYGAVVISDRYEKIRECTTKLAESVAEAVAEDAFSGPIDSDLILSVKMDRPQQVAAKSPIHEENYDFRYVPEGVAKDDLNAGLGGLDFSSVSALLSSAYSQYLEGELFENTKHLEWGDGALWANDCVVANGGERPEVHNISQVVGKDKSVLGDYWMCSSRAMDEHYGLSGGYLMNTALRFIPEEPQLLAWRRVDNRTSFKQANEYPFATIQAMGALLGNFDGASQYTYNPEESNEVVDVQKRDPLVYCEDLERGSSAYNVYDLNQVEPFFSSKLTASFGTMLSSPGLWEQYIEYGIPEGEFDWEYCESREGGIYSARMVWEDMELRKKWWRPEKALPRGVGYKAWNNEASSDSCMQEYNVRDGPLSVFETEAELHCRDQTQTILSETREGVGSVPAMQFATGEIGLGTIAPNDEEARAKALGAVPQDRPDLLLPENVFTMLDSPYGDTEDDVMDLLFPPEKETIVDPITGEEEEVELTINNLGDRGAPVYALSDVLTAACGVSVIYDDWINIRREWYDELEDHLHNIFLGNPMHLASEVVGSAGFYTPDSIRRDELMMNRDNVKKGATYKGDVIFGEDATANRDVFDSLLEMAAPEKRIDFANTDTGDYLMTFAFSRISQFFEAYPLKSLGDRYQFDVINRPRWVDYPLNAQNFESYFPAYPDPAGGHPDYGKWVDIVGGVCNVWPGPGNNPTGQMRTCKVNSCKVITKGWSYNSSTGNYSPTTDSRNCDKFEELAAAEAQKDTTNKNPPRPSAPGSVTFTRVDLSVNRGPYKRILPFKEPLHTTLEQDDLRLEYNEGRSATPYDGTAVAANRFRQKFQSPEEEGNIESGRIIQVDYQHSKNPHMRPVKGYDSRGYGFDPDSGLLHSIAESPSGPRIRAPMNDIKYHCWMTFENMDGTPRNNPVTNDREPVYQPAGGNPVIPIYGPSKDWPWPEYDENEIDYYWECPVRPFVFGECTTDAFDKIPGGIDVPLPEAIEYFHLFILPEKLAVYPELLEAYGFASANTGVPCEIMAGIHFMEASNSPDQSCHDGHPISVSDLPNDCLTAAQHLVKKLGGKPVQTWKFRDYVWALDHYNGPGNQNCDDPRTPWCPAPQTPLFYGEDHPYPMSWMDGAHGGLSSTPMYIKYCYDFTLCTSDVEGTDDSGWLPMMRPGAIAVAKALNMYLGGQ